MKRIAIIGTKEGSIGHYLLQNLETPMMPYELEIDVTDDAEVERGFKNWAGAFEGMVYAAGIYEYGKVKDMSVDKWREIIEVNLIGALKCVKWFISTQKSGVMVLIGANAAHVPSAGSSAYCVSKAGMSMLTKVASQEVDGKFSIIQIDPGIVRGTGMYHDTYKNMGISEGEMLEKRLKTVPINRASSKAEMNKWIQFLLRYGNYANGSSLRVDGGKMVPSGKEN